MSKTLVIGTIVVVVGLFALGGFLLLQMSQQQAGPNQVSPTPEPQPQETDNQQSTIDTSDWQTYRSDERGFEFAYPAGWTIDAQYIDHVSFGAQEPHFIRLGIMPYSGVKIPENDARFSCDEVIVGGEVGIRCINEQVTWSQEELNNWESIGTIPNKIAWIEVEHNEYFYIFEVVGSPERENEFHAFDQILSTFRFVE